MWYAGIDWADEHHDVLVIDEAGRQVSSLRVTHTKEGLNQLTTFLENIAGSATKEQMACMIETSHGLLIAALLDAGCAVYPVNPKMVDRRRRPSGAKTDAIDAYLLAKLGRSEFNDLRRLQPDSGLVQELNTLTRDQDSLMQSQTRLVNQLTGCLKAYYPAALELFTKLQQHSCLLFWQTYPTPEAAQSASVEEMTSVLKAAGHTNPSKVAPHIFLTHEDLETFSSLPGAGKRLAPRLLAEWGDDRARYNNASTVQALAGTAPVPFESGNYSKVHKRDACVKPLRNALHQFAWESTRLESWAKEYYQRKRKEGKSHSMAVRALANVWVRIIFAMWSKHEGYETATFLVAQQSHRRLAA
jgi:transposase